MSFFKKILQVPKRWGAEPSGNADPDSLESRLGAPTISGPIKVGDDGTQVYLVSQRGRPDVPDVMDINEAMRRGLARVEASGYGSSASALIENKSGRPLWIPPGTVFTSQAGHQSRTVVSDGYLIMPKEEVNVDGLMCSMQSGSSAPAKAGKSAGNLDAPPAVTVVGLPEYQKALEAQANPSGSTFYRSDVQGHLWHQINSVRAVVGFSGSDNLADILNSPQFVRQSRAYLDELNAAIRGARLAGVSGVTGLVAVSLDMNFDDAPLLMVDYSASPRFLRPKAVANQAAIAAKLVSERGSVLSDVDPEYIVDLIRHIYAGNPNDPKSLVGFSYVPGVQIVPYGVHVTPFGAREGIFHFDCYNGLKTVR